MRSKPRVYPGLSMKREYVVKNILDLNSIHPFFLLRQRYRGFVWVKGVGERERERERVRA